MITKQSDEREQEIVQMGGKKKRQKFSYIWYNVLMRYSIGSLVILYDRLHFLPDELSVIFAVESY